MAFDPGRSFSNGWFLVYWGPRQALIKQAASAAAGRTACKVSVQGPDEELAPYPTAA